MKDKFYQNIQIEPYKLEDLPDNDLIKMTFIQKQFNNKFSKALKLKIECCSSKNYKKDSASQFVKNQLITSLIDDIKKWGNSPIHFMSEEVFFNLLKWFNDNKDSVNYGSFTCNPDPFHLNFIRWPNRKRIQDLIGQPIHFEHTTPITDWAKNTLIEKVLKKEKKERLAETIKQLEDYSGVCLITKIEDDKLSKTYFSKCICSYGKGFFLVKELGDDLKHKHRSEIKNKFGKDCKCNDLQRESHGYKGNRPRGWMQCYEDCGIKWIARKTYYNNKTEIHELFNQGNKKEIIERFFCLKEEPRKVLI